MRLAGMRALRKNFGFSLIEVLVVIAIISVLAGLATLAFNSWNRKVNVEAQVRKMATDISELRIRSLTSKQRHNIVLNKTGYNFQSYTTSGQPKCSGTTPGGENVTGMNRTVFYNLKKDASTYYAGSCENIGGDTIEIDTQGVVVGSNATIFVEYPGGNASVDCLTIHTVRVNIGKTNGASCDDR
jgi:type IV fimbrial biogenesis protein FimT